VRGREEWGRGRGDKDAIELWNARKKRIDIK